MNTWLKIGLCLLLAPAPIWAQSPVAAGRAPIISGSIGYSYLDFGSDRSARIGLNGVDASATADLFPRVGIKLDLGYVRASNVLGSGRDSDVLSYLAGPVFYPTRGRLTTYVQGLFGGARVTGAVPFKQGEFLVGFINRPAWAVGGGAEFTLSPSFGLRGGIDYLRASYTDSTATIKGQLGIRTVASIVYYPGHRKHH
jgi:opacity protein-like surface antigen